MCGGVRGGLGSLCWPGLLGGWGGHCPLPAGWAVLLPVSASQTVGFSSPIALLLFTAPRGHSSAPLLCQGWGRDKGGMQKEN